MDDALGLLDTLAAPAHLKRHVTLVAEAAAELLALCQRLDVAIDAEFVRIGVAIHDIGKIEHQREMHQSGSEHEVHGEALLLELGVAPEIARCCLSHARWESMECSLEELLIALADKLWKGKRVEALEMRVIEEISQLLKKDTWDLFTLIDSAFEAIAADGYDRLQASRGGVEPQGDDS